jgi:alcohol dehydrogenase
MMINIAERFDKMANGMLPVTDTEVPMNVVADLLKPMERRHVFGTIGVGL